ncbi:MAG: hypothetical protein COX19_07105 [Desulfobacterales bacterium CG23_combo_of_CG06-09_8_20_14_all_51_8]|nr:MAG: hypothetical protein COX19_07105 [Desulfobacterales bacterium CG23_combo_of_CG06-09_8_20_14_all_51_8]
MIGWLRSPPRLALRSVASAGARITTVGALLLTTSLAARKMSAEEFGLWSILIALMFLFLIFDFGFRYGLSNRMAALVARSGGRPEPEQPNTFMSVLWLQCLIGIVGGILCLAIFPALPWVKLFKIHQADLAGQVPHVMAFTGAFLFLYLPFSLAGSVFYAYQEITLVSILSGAQSLVLLAVFALTVFRLSFLYVVTAYFAVYLSTGLIMTVILLRKRRWLLRWVPWMAQISLIRSISRPSLDFFILCFSASLTTTAGTFLAGAVAGLKEAGDFALLQKIFSLLITLHLALLAPLAPAYTQHAQLDQWNWVRQKLAFSVLRIWPLVFIGGGGLFFLFHPMIIRLWAGRWLPNFTLAGLLALWALTSGWINTHSILLNSLGIVRFQGMFFLAMVIPVLALPLILGRWWGIHGVALAGLICAAPAAVIWPAYTARALKEKWLRV